MNIDSILGVIPARYASTRFPGKPLVDISGKPMIQHVYERVSEFLNYVYVATDDERIYKAVKAFNGRVVMTSEKHQSGTDRCAEALDLVENELKRSFDVVLNIQGDEPFIEPELLQTLSSCFLSSVTEIATLIKKLTDQDDLFNPNKPKVVFNPKYEALYFSRSVIPFIRDYPKNEWLKKHDYYLHIGLYGFRSDVLREITTLKPSSLEFAESLEQLRWIENGYVISVRPVEYEAMGVDTPEDLEQIKSNL